MAADPDGFYVILDKISFDCLLSVLPRFRQVVQFQIHNLVSRRGVSWVSILFPSAASTDTQA